MSDALMAMQRQVHQGQPHFQRRPQAAQLPHAQNEPPTPRVRSDRPNDMRRFANAPPPNRA
jgi:hypothetical protein